MTYNKIPRTKGNESICDGPPKQKISALVAVLAIAVAPILAFSTPSSAIDPDIPGLMRIPSFIISNHTRIELTSDLCLISVGTIRIEGTLEAARPGINIRLLSLTNDVVVTGSLIAGNGANGSDASGIGIVRAENGGAGGSIALLAPLGHVYVTGTLQTGNGGDGGEATVVAVSPFDEAHGGKGGAGGNLYVLSSAHLGSDPLTEPLKEATLAGSNGGDGGVARLFNAHGSTNLAQGGDGGSIGKVQTLFPSMFDSTKFDGSLLNCLSESDQISDAEAVSEGDSATITCFFHRRGGSGADAYAVGSNGDTGDGVDAPSIGDIPPLNKKLIGLDGTAGWSTPGEAGGTAKGGDGEPGCPGGNGGSAFASGGRGGNGGTGGRGGDGCLKGGNGGPGGEGGEGGAGGDAQGGAGGAGGMYWFTPTRGGNGGSAYANGGDGGNGGNGGSGGSAINALVAGKGGAFGALGAGGAAGSATPGAPGAGPAGPGSAGSLSAGLGSNGSIGGKGSDGSGSLGVCGDGVIELRPTKIVE